VRKATSRGVAFISERYPLAIFGQVRFTPPHRPEALFSSALIVVSRISHGVAVPKYHLPLHTQDS